MIQIEMSSGRVCHTTGCDARRNWCLQLQIFTEVVGAGSIAQASVWLHFPLLLLSDNLSTDKAKSGSDHGSLNALVLRHTILKQLFELLLYLALDL
jgi:hypothetical protein